jgi:hypothetical protein
VLLERGQPDTPYLSAATARVTLVNYSDVNRVLTVEAMGVTGQEASYTVISPWPVRGVEVNGVSTNDASEARMGEGLYRVTVKSEFGAGGSADADETVVIRITF